MTGEPREKKLLSPQQQLLNKISLKVHLIRDKLNIIVASLVLFIFQEPERSSMISDQRFLTTHFKLLNLK